MSERPWFKFFPADWRADASLRMVSMGARALWIEMLCLMHEGTPRGFLTIRGKEVSTKQLAILAGCSVDDVSGYLLELDEAEVFSRSSAGVIHSRKMAREGAVSEVQTKRVQKRWSPSFTEMIEEFSSGNTGMDTEPHTGSIPIFQSPEAEAEEESKIGVALTSAPPDTKGAYMHPDFRPSEATFIVVVGKGMIREDAENEFVKFRDHWLSASGQRARKRDWNAAFRVWCTKSGEFQRERQGSRMASVSGHAKSGGRGAFSFADLHNGLYSERNDEIDVSGGPGPILDGSAVRISRRE